jgi:hypothetical protein
MSTQKKRGRYNKFDISRASWCCPSCNRDSLVLKPWGDDRFTFYCASCEFDSKMFAVSVTKKSSFNRVHRWLVREFPWLCYLVNRWYDMGVESTKDL